MSVLLLTRKKTGYETKRLIESFKEKNIDINIHSPSTFDIIVNSDKDPSIKRKGKDYKMPELVFLRGTSGENNFNLTLLRQFEELLIPVINTPDSIENAKDKLLTSQLLASYGIPITRTLMFRRPVNVKTVEEQIGFPCVIKITTGSRGFGVYLCKTEDEFESLMQFVISFNKNKTLIIQEYIGERVGEDLRVMVVGGKVIGTMKRKSNKDFRANISQGGSGEVYPLNDEVEFLARESAKILGLDIAGVDLLFDKRGFRVCEVNSNPGFKGFEKYCNLDVAGAITEYIKFRI